MKAEQRRMGGVLVASLVAALVVLALPREEATHRDGDTRLWSLREAEIHRVDLAGPMGRWSLVRQGELWTVESKGRVVPAAPHARRRVIDALEEAAVGVGVLGGPQAEQGFDGTTVTVHTEGAVRTLSIGGPAVAGRGFVAEGERVVAVRGGIHEDVRVSAESLWETRVVPEGATRIAVGVGEGAWIAELDESWQWVQGGQGDATVWAEEWRDARVERWEPVGCDMVPLVTDVDVREVCVDGVRMADGRVGRMEPMEGMYTDW